MSRRQTFFAYASLVVGVIAIASSFARPSAGQPAPGPIGPIGRYQVATAPVGQLVMIDTVSGKIWSTGNDGANWTEFKSPFDKK